MLFAPKCKDRINNAIEILLILARITYFTSIIPRVFSSAKEEEGNCEGFSAGAIPNLNHYISSPKFPLKYPQNIDCVRIIKAPPGYSILLRFNKDIFQIESAFEGISSEGQAIPPPNCPNDYLEVRDGRYSFSDILGRFCGSKSPEYEVRTKSGFMFLHFHTDGSIEYRGFSATFEFVKSVSVRQSYPECHISISNQLDGIVNSSVLNNFYNKAIHPLADNSAIDCVWEIRTAKPLLLALFIDEMELRLPNQCHSNFLEIYTGELAIVPERKHCTSPSTQFYSEESTVFIRFYGRSTEDALLSRFRILFSTYVHSTDCIDSSFFPCGGDICIARELVCNGRLNCEFGLDEKNCSKDKSLLQRITRSGYIQLGLVLVLVAIVVSILCLYYRPCRKTTRHKEPSTNYVNSHPKSQPQMSREKELKSACRKKFGSSVMNNTEQNGNLLRASNPNTSWMATNDIISSKNESSMGLNDDAEEMIWIKPNALLSKTTICNICNSLC